MLSSDVLKCLGMEGKLEGALEKVLNKPRELVEVDMAGKMKESGLEKFLPANVWPPMAAVSTPCIRNECIIVRATGTGVSDQGQEGEGLCGL